MKQDRQRPFQTDRSLKLRRIARCFARRGAEVNRKKRRREVEKLQPSLIDLRRKIMSLRIFFGVAEAGVVIEVPLDELGRRDAAGDGVEDPDPSIHSLVLFVQNRTMRDLVEQNREVEKRKPRDERERKPQIPAIKVDDCSRRRSEHSKKRKSHQEMNHRPFLM